MSEQNVLHKPLSRRDFLKTLGAAGVATAFTSAIPAVALGATLPKSSSAALPLAVDAVDQLLAVPKDRQLLIYSRMFRSRTYETAVKDYRLAAQKDPMVGNLYSYVGEEASMGGVVMALNDDDLIGVTHRSQGGAVIKGSNLQKCCDEIMFRTTGACGGYGGTMHIVDREAGMLAANGIVGGGWYTAFGAAYAGLVDGSMRIAVSFAGDGATNSSYFFNAVRNAVMYKVPAMFVIENNLYQSGAYYRDVSPVDNLSDLVKGLGVQAFSVDGNDIAAVYAAAKAGVDKARAGDGPTVIETKTYRWYDHSGFAGAKAGVDGAWGLNYRSDDELRAWMLRDPIKRYRAFLLDLKVATEDELAKIEADEKASVASVIENAKNAPVPTGEMGLLNVYKEGPIPATQFYNGKGLAA
ncbi:thiamine pyrophosphate-dependent enzyme [Petrachloros mirabilis]